MDPMKRAASWWPETMGRPSIVGSQNGLRFAFFPGVRRLLIEQEGRLTTYETGDHQIIGVSSRSHNELQSVEFSSQLGVVDLKDLDIVG